MKAIWYQINNSNTYEHGIFYSALEEKKIPVLEVKSNGNFYIETKYSPAVLEVSKEKKIPISYITTLDYQKDKDSTGLIIAITVGLAFFAVFSKPKKKGRK